jgi:acyl-ACP thioesterase
MEINVQTLYKSKIHIDLRDVDFTKKVKLSTLFSYFQDIASLAADDLGFGINHLNEEFGVSWILVKIRVDIERIPEWDEELTIETWPLEPGRIEFERDYIVRDQNGEVIIRAISVWVLMDLKERRLKRGNTIGIHYPKIIKERALDAKLSKLKDYGLPELAYKKTIGYSDVDFNGHLNNSKYVDYIMDCFSVNEHMKYRVQSIELNFINEALPGHTISLWKDETRVNDGYIYIEGLNENNNKTVFKTQLHIRER